MDWLWCAQVLWHLLLRVMRWPRVPVAAELLVEVVEVVEVAVVLPVPDRPVRRRARSRWS
jgi:hypothetical protein